MAVVTAARQFATQSGNDFNFGAVDAGGKDFKDTLESIFGIGNSDGKTVFVRAEDADDPAIFEVAEVTFHTGTPNKVTWVETVESSTGSQVVFTGSVIVFGVTVSQHFNVVALQRPDTQEITTGLVTTSSTSAVAACDTYSVTPIRDDSKLQVSLSFNGLVRRTSSGGGLLAHVSGGYVNDAPTPADVQKGSDISVGMFNFDVDEDLTIQFNVPVKFTLSSSEVNGAGDWEIQPMFFCAGAGRNIECQVVQIQVEEYITNY